MPLKPEENNEFKVPERPLECTECKKPIAVRYTEIVGETVTHTSMCADCPELLRRLYGLNHEGSSLLPGETRLACGECGTSLEAIRVGTSLGCNNCYEVFGDIIVAELIAEEKIPIRVANNKKHPSIHIGRSPGEIPEMSPSSRLITLNEALHETLKIEDYEQAAWLRDQIKALTEKPEKKDD